jgi:hypothetical protein
MPTATSGTYTPTTARATFAAAFSMARRMIRRGTRHGLGDRYATFLVAARARFGDAAMPVARAAAGAALARLHLDRAATGTPAELDRQGKLSRCVRLEKAPGGHGWFWAWCFDSLAGVYAARSLRSCRANALREERAARATEVQRRAIARGLAADRRAMEAGRFYAITPAGRAALAGAV